MFKFFHKLFKRKKKHKLPHREEHVGHNWFYYKSVPNPAHPEFLEQADLCAGVIKDLIKYGLLESHHRTWKISRDIHIPSLRYYLCTTHPEYKFRIHCKRYWFQEKMDVTIFVEHVKPFAAQSRISMSKEELAAQRKTIIDQSLSELNAILKMFKGI